MSLFHRLLEACGLLAAGSLLLWTLGYALVYRKLLRGEKQVAFFSVLKIILFVLYIFAVLYVTVLDRTLVTTSEGVRFVGGSEMAWNLIPLRDFIFHGEHRLIVPIRYAVLNTMMFIPMGLLLPLVSRKFYQGKRVLCCGACFSLLIESIQLFGRIGIFELDDLLFNTLGAIVGWLLFRMVFAFFGLPVKSKQNPERFLA